MSAEIPPDVTASQVHDTLKQILRWVKFQSLDRARQVIEKEVGQDSKRILVYELADGERGRPEVTKLSAVPSSTIQAWWDRWFKLGIMEASPKRKGMVRKLCSLEEVGLDLPKEVKAVLDGKSAQAESPPIEVSTESRAREG